MNRRQLLTFATVALSTAGATLNPREVYAQDGEVERIISEILATSAWSDQPEAYFQSRSGAFLYAEFVDYFGAPDGNVPARQSADSPYEYLRTLLPGQFNGWLQTRAALLTSYVDSNRRPLVAAMTQLQRVNIGIYDAWLRRVGIVPSGPVANTIFSGQVLATVVSLAVNDPDGATFVDRIQGLDWWFFPLC